MVELVCEEVFVYAGTHEPKLVLLLVHIDPGFADGAFAVADGLDFGADEHNAHLERLVDEVEVRCLPVHDDRRALLLLLGHALCLLAPAALLAAVGRLRFPADLLLLHVRDSFVERLHEFLAAVACHGGGDDDLLAVLLEFLDGVVDSEVALVERDNECLFGEFRMERLEFILQDLELFVGVFGKAVDDEQQRVRAFDVLEELVAEALAFAGAFQETGNVGDHEAVAVCLHDAEHRFEGCKRVVADFGATARNLVHEARFARIRESDEADVCHELEFQEKFALFAFFAGRALAGRLYLRRCEMLVAHAALAAARRDPLLARNGQVCEDASFGILHDGSARDAYDKVFGATPGAALGAAGLSVASLVEAGVAHVQKRGVLLVDLQYHVATASAVASVGASQGYELFTVKTADAVTALAGANFD